MIITLVLLDGSKQILGKAGDWPESYHFWLGQRVEIYFGEDRKEFAVMAIGRQPEGQPYATLQEVPQTSET